MSQWTARQVWREMSKQDRLEAAQALLGDERLDRLTRLQVLAPWMAAQGIRPPFYEQLPKSRRAELLAGSAAPEESAAQLLLSLHLVSRRPMLSRFLDLLGIPHSDGLIDEKFDGEISPAKIAEAAESLVREYPRDQVTLYFRTLLSSDPQLWAPLEVKVS